MDNIRYGRLDATDEECIAAAKLANAHGFIKRLSDGYQTWLSGGGANLSQGQRQLLAIARAAAANPPVMILDEATSSIDTRTETYVQKGMDALMKGRTSFVIAHQLSTVKNADCIMVMQQGRIIERGTHDELIDQKESIISFIPGTQSVRKLYPLLFTGWEHSATVQIMCCILDTRTLEEGALLDTRTLEEGRCPVCLFRYRMLRSSKHSVAEQENRTAPLTRRPGGHLF